jgi:hypothetical protein
VNGDGFRSTTKVAAFSVPYFDENDGLIIFHDQVNFTQPAGKIPLQQLETLPG